jgi:predicted N-formylglutamate amidohydrolase
MQPFCDFQAFETLPGAPQARLLLLCDHASNAIPPAYGDLGLSEEARARHIAYDIGAAGVTRALSRLLDAPAVLSTFSRLLIDPNRGADDPTLVMRISDGALIPGNARIDQREIDHRIACFWRPYRQAAAAKIAAMTQALGAPPVVLSIHSFTPVWRGVPRPWNAGLLWDLDDRLARPMIAALADADTMVGDNEPYDGALKGDTMYDLCTARGVPHALLEIRQDLIADAAGQADWAARLERILPPMLEAPPLRRAQMFGSRAGVMGNQK